MSRGAISAAMIDKALPPACLAEARSTRDRRGPGWIGKTVDIIQRHNANIKFDKHCRTCGSSNEILWD